MCDLKPNKRDMKFYSAGRIDRMARLASLECDRKVLDEEKDALIAQAVALPPFEIAPLVWGHDDDQYMAEGCCGFSALWKSRIKERPMCEVADGVNMGPKTPMTEDEAKAWCQTQYQEYCASIIDQMQGGTDD